MRVFGTENMEEILNNINPANIINDLEPTNISLFKIDYSYTTIRGNKKNGTKYLLNNVLNPSFDCKKRFNEWMENYNKVNTHRPLLNVKILKGSCLGVIKI